jgi:hypothetical protein
LSISYHYSTCLPSMFSISFHISTYLSFITSYFEKYTKKVYWIVKWYGRKTSRIVVRYEQYGKKASWIGIEVPKTKTNFWFSKYNRVLHHYCMNMTVAAAAALCYRRWRHSRKWHQSLDVIFCVTFSRTFNYFRKFSFSSQNLYLLSILQHVIASKSNHIVCYRKWRHSRKWHQSLSRKQDPHM